MSSVYDPRTSEEAKRILGCTLARLASDEFNDGVVEEGYEETAEELLDNWDMYGDQHYHGTQLNNLNSILKQGALVPGDRNNATSGEVSNQSTLYYTSLEPVAIHYAEKAHPTREEVKEAVFNDMENILSCEEWSEVKQNYDLLHDLIPSGMDGETLTDYQKERYEALYDRLFDIPDQKPEPLVVGFDEKDVRNYRTPPEVEHEFEAEEIGEHLAEGVASRVDIGSETSFYFSQNQLQPIREKYENFEGNILSLDALKLRYRLKMDPVYEEKGMIEMESFWSGDKRKLGWNEKPKKHGLNNEISG